MQIDPKRFQSGVLQCPCQREIRSSLPREEPPTASPLASRFHYNEMRFFARKLRSHSQSASLGDIQQVQPSLEGLRHLRREARLSILGVIVSAGLGALYFVPRVPLGPEYHNFVDKRALFGIPNCLDVLSNLLFLFIGVWGLVFLLKPSASAGFRESRERVPYLVFFAGVALTGVGSGLYHMSPNNDRLIWDLLPMTFSFVALVAASYTERVSVRGGLLLLLPLLALGAASVFYWNAGELHGDGDLRFYLFVQFFPAVVIAAIIAMFPPAYTRTYDLGIAFGFYVLAKAFEVLDRPIYSLGRIASGHTLKHLTAGLTCYWILRMLKLRAPLYEGAPMGRPTNSFGARVEQRAASRPSAS